jgi:hypothetical protein
VEGKIAKENELYSRKVRAGKRTYFFDIRSTRGNDYYLTITESKKKLYGSGFSYEKHKIFLYKEDVNKFLQALTEAIEHLKQELMPEYDFDSKNNINEDSELEWE